MKIRTEFNEKDLLRIRKALDRMGSDQRKVFFRRVGVALKSDFDMGFRRGCSPRGNPWKSVLRGGQPLRDTRRLQGSLTVRATSDSTEVGTNVDYGPAHQEGVDKAVTVPTHTRLINQAFGRKLSTGVYQTVKSHKRKMNIEARPFLGIERPQQRKIVRVFGQYMRELGAEGNAT